MSRLKLLITFCILAYSSLASFSLHAHKFAPSLLKIVETAPAEYNVVWKTPILRSSSMSLVPQFPSHCALISSKTVQVAGTGVIHRSQLGCSTSLVGKEITVAGVVENRSSVLFSVELLDKSFYQTLLNREKPSFIIPPQSSNFRVMKEYSWLGAEHIWGGIDHLLFVFGLLLLVGGGKRLVWTITAFTVGHSVTLSLVTLGYFDYPVALVEFIIALSIFILAVELTKPVERGLFRRHPSWLAGGFGLLHGMGFAGALADVGLPQQAVPQSLLFFNIGIELGQLAFICVVGIANFMLKKLLPRRSLESGDVAEKASNTLTPNTLLVYVMGSLSAMWCIERGLEIIS